MLMWASFAAFTATWEKSCPIRAASKLGRDEWTKASEASTVLVSQPTVFQRALDGASPSNLNKMRRIRILAASRLTRRIAVATIFATVDGVQRR